LALLIQAPRVRSVHESVEDEGEEDEEEGDVLPSEAGGSEVDFGMVEGAEGEEANEEGEEDDV